MTSPELLHTTKDAAFRTLAQGVFSSLMRFDRRAGVSRHDACDDRVMVHTEHNDSSDTVVYYFPGYRQQLLPVRNAVQPLLHEAGTVRYFGSPGGYYRDDALEDALLENLEEDTEKTIKVVGVSNGGKEALYQLSKPTVQQAVPFVKSVNLDSSPSDYGDIRLSFRIILAAGNTLDPDSWFCQKLFSGLTHVAVGRQKIFQDAVAELAYAVSRTTASTPLGPSQSQYASLIRPLPDTLHMLGLRIGEINYVSSSYDATVKTSQAADRIEQMSEHRVNRIIDPNRKHGNHAGISDDPRFFAKILKYGYEEAFERQELATI